MGKNGSKDNFKLLYLDLTLISKAKENLKNSEAMRGYDAELSKLAATVSYITKYSDIKQLIEAEETCLKYEAQYLTNSKEQTNSLKAALAQVPAAEKAADSIHNKQAYKDFIIESFGKKGKGRDGLPNDGAREFFASQKSRLETLSKGWGSDAEKALFKARYKMLDAAEKTYGSEQRKALGLEEEKTRPAAKESAPAKSAQQQAHEKVFESLVADLPPDK